MGNLILCFGGFLVPLSTTQRDEARRVEVQYRVSARGALCLPSSLFKPLQRRYNVYIANGDIGRWSDALLQGSAVG